MADAIVVLDSSDDDDDLRKRTHKTSNANKKRASPKIGKKRKIQPTFQDDISIPSKRTHSTYPEDLTTDQRLSLLPLMASVDTLATPSATPPLQLLASPPRNANTSKEIDKSPINVEKETGRYENVEKATKRVKPITILKESDDAWQQARQKRLASVTSQSSTPTPNSELGANSPSTVIMDLTTPIKEVSSTEMKTTDSAIEANADEKQTPLEERAPLQQEYEELINECRKADPSADMEKLIDTKLLKYYYSVHPDFVKSRGFRKNVTSAIERIRAEPELVYYNLKTVVDELNVRRKCKNVIVTNDDATTSASNTTGNKHTDEQIKKLNKALYILKKRISRLEEAEVDWEDEDSSYLQVERFKKRACQIYEKICDLTGESKNARRLVKKPIQFSGTPYAQFNKTLQAYVNRTKEFPDYFDVLRMLEHCNRQYDLELPSFELKRIAQDAFIKVGKLLQSRRKTDLYETVAHFTANCTDPAAEDPMLLAKLKENEKTRTKISDVIEKYARAQDDPDAAEELQFSHEVDDENMTENSEENGNGNGKVESVKRKKNCLPSDESDDDDDDDEDDENLDLHVEKLTKDNTIDMSDVDTDTEMNDEIIRGVQSEVVAFKDHNKVDSKIVEEKKAHENHEVQLTENNNIVRTKTTESSVAIKETNGIAVQESNNDSSVMIIDNDTSIVSLGAKCKEVTSKPLKTTSANKTSSNPSKHRTIAEIVISDEE